MLEHQPAFAQILTADEFKVVDGIANKLTKQEFFILFCAFTKCQVGNFMSVLTEFVNEDSESVQEQLTDEIIDYVGG